MPAASSAGAVACLNYPEYWPDRREGQYITRELNIPLYCPTQKECNNRLLYDSNLVGGKWKGRGKGRKREEKEGGGGGVRAGVAGEDQTRAPSCHYNFEDSAILQIVLIIPNEKVYHTS